MKLIFVKLFVLVVIYERKSNKDDTDVAKGRIRNKQYKSLTKRKPNRITRADQKK